MRYMLLIYEDEADQHRHHRADAERQDDCDGRPLRRDQGANRWLQYRGYNIVETANLEEARSIAARHPGVRAGRHAIEVRPISKRP